MRTAYLLAMIRNNEFLGAAMFSEPSLTIMKGSLFAQILSAKGETYEEARNRCLEMVDLMYPWLNVVSRCQG